MAEQWEKQCDCVGATASGPRVLTETVEEGGRILFKAHTVRFACDSCDTPWRCADPSIGEETR